MAFKKGEGGGKKGRISPQPSQLLRDMREAYRSPTHVEGESPGLRVCRTLLAENPDKFLTRLERMEKDLKASKGEPDPTGVSALEEDPRTERVLDLARLVLQELTEASDG